MVELIVKVAFTVSVSVADITTFINTLDNRYHVSIVQVPSTYTPASKNVIPPTSEDVKNLSRKVVLFVAVRFENNHLFVSVTSFMSESAGAVEPDPRAR